MPDQGMTQLAILEVRKIQTFTSSGTQRKSLPFCQTGSRLVGRWFLEVFGNKRSRNFNFWILLVERWKQIFHKVFCVNQPASHIPKWFVKSFPGGLTNLTARALPLKIWLTVHCTANVTDYTLYTTYQLSSFHCSEGSRVHYVGELASSYLLQFTLPMQILM